MRRAGDRCKGPDWGVGFWSSRFSGAAAVSLSVAGQANRLPAYKRPARHWSRRCEFRPGGAYTARMKRLRKLAFVPGLMVVSLAAMGPVGVSDPETALAQASPADMVVEQDPLTGDQFIYVVFHALDRDGFCNPPVGAVSLHPVLGIPVDFVIESGDGIIIDSSTGSATPRRSANDVPTFSTAVNATLAAPVRAFAPLVDGLKDECQAWIKVSQSIPGPLRVLVSVPSDDGKSIMWVADLERETARDLDLNFRWTLITWGTAGSMAPAEALAGDAGGAVPRSTDGTRQPRPGGHTSPRRQASRGERPRFAGRRAGYWVAVKGPGGATWTVPE